MHCAALAFLSFRRMPAELESKTRLHLLLAYAHEAVTGAEYSQGVRIGEHCAEPIRQQPSMLRAGGNLTTVQPGYWYGDLTITHQE